MILRRTLFAVAALMAVVLAAGPAWADTQPVVTFDRDDVDVSVGDRFTLVSTAGGLVPGQPLIAHLNIVSLTSDVYVDPEDWSDQRTQSIPPASKQLTWQLQAVNVGRFDVYVVIVPTAGGGPLWVSDAVRVSVAQRRAINAGGALPIAIAVPLLLAGAVAALRYRRHLRAVARALLGRGDHVGGPRAGR